MRQESTRQDPKTMNHIYRLCWNRELRQWVAASELAQCRRGVASSGRVVGRRAVRLSLLSAALGFGALAHAGTAPTGGQIVAGAGQITQSGNTTTIHQDSGVLSLNWQSFDVGADQTVNFLQPGAGAIAVNRILGNTASEIYGHLNANGQVWLVNPNGVLFGKSAQVNVGGLVASTLDLDDSTLGTGEVRFAGNGKGRITNLGSLTAADGGYVVGPQSVGAALPTQGLVFGGATTTLTDAAVRAGRVAIGDTAPPEPLDGDAILAEAARLLADAVDRARTAAQDVPLVAVGGGSFLVPDALPGISEVLRPDHHDVANAVGAAIAVWHIAPQMSDSVIPQAQAATIEASAR